MTAAERLRPHLQEGLTIREAAELEGIPYPYARKAVRMARIDLRALRWGRAVLALGPALVDFRRWLSEDPLRQAIADERFTAPTRSIVALAKEWEIPEPRLRRIQATIERKLAELLP